MDPLRRRLVSMSALMWRCKGASEADGGERERERAREIRRMD